MKEYVERDAVMQKFTDHVKRSNNSDFAPTPTWNEAVQIVEDAPAADVAEVRHGRWIKITKVHPDLLNDSTYNYRCSNCGYMDTHGANVEVPYCWHCGAKMDGGADDE